MLIIARVAETVGEATCREGLLCEHWQFAPDAFVQTFVSNKYPSNGTHCGYLNPESTEMRRDDAVGIGLKLDAGLPPGAMPGGDRKDVSRTSPTVGLPSVAKRTQSYPTSQVRCSERATGGKEEFAVPESLPAAPDVHPPSRGPPSGTPGLASFERDCGDVFAGDKARNVPTGQRRVRKAWTPDEESLFLHTLSKLGLTEPEIHPATGKVRVRLGLYMSTKF